MESAPPETATPSGSTGSNRSTANRGQAATDARKAERDGKVVATAGR